MAAPQFTLKVGDGLGAHIGASEELFAGASAILTPNIKDGNMVLVDGKLRAVPAVPVTLDSNGKLNGNTGIQLLADDPSLGLDEGSHLEWHIKIKGAKQRGFRQTVKEWWIPAGTAGTTVDLATAPPVVGTTAVGSRGVPGPGIDSVGSEGTELIAYVQGSEVGRADLSVAMQGAAEAVLSLIHI